MNKSGNSNPTTSPEGFVPCPLCKQYNHSIGGDQLADAFMVFQSMFSHRNDGIPTQFCFDEKARDAAQVLMAAARQPQSPDTSEVDEILRVYENGEADAALTIEALVELIDGVKSKEQSND